MRYVLGDAAIARRARVTAALGAATAIAPIALAIVLLRRLGWAPTAAFWAVAAALGALVVVRAVLQLRTARRRLRAFAVEVDDDEVRAHTSRDAWAIERAAVARIGELEGPLGGLRIESRPDPRSGVVDVIDVPRGGDRFGDLRAALEGWRAIERRGRRSRVVRIAVGAAIVAAIFFLPFVRDDLVGRSKVVAALLVLGAWIAMRTVARGR